MKLAGYYPVLDRNSITESFEATRKAFGNRPDLLTYEGNIAILYWAELRKVFTALYPTFNFTNRNGRRHSWNMNASDEVNALLNYGYAILEAEVMRAINSVGLESSVGFLHDLKDFRYSLCWDLIEPFRVIVDLAVLQLLEEKKLKKADFLVTEGYNLRLKPATAQALGEKIRIGLNKSVPYKGKNHSYGNILIDQARELASYILGNVKSLVFNVPKIQLGRVDDIGLRDRILSITPEERSRLDLRRNTLWYIQKNIRGGKRVKIYDKIRQKL